MQARLGTTKLHARLSAMARLSAYTLRCLALVMAYLFIMGEVTAAIQAAQPGVSGSQPLAPCSSCVHLEAAVAPVADGRAEEVRVLYPNEWGILHPGGVAYLPAFGYLALVDRETLASPGGGEAPVVVITPYEELVGSVDLPYQLDEPVNMAYDSTDNRLFLLDAVRNRLAWTSIAENGIPEGTSLAEVDISHLGLHRAAGIAVHGASRQLLILDTMPANNSARLVGADLEQDFRLVSTLDLSPFGTANLRGLAVHPDTDHFFLTHPAAGVLYQLDQSGQLLHTYDLTALELVDPQGIVFAPSADLTDPADTIHLWMADSGLADNESLPSQDQKVYLPRVVQSMASVSAMEPQDLGVPQSLPSFGRLLELALVLDAPLPTATSAATPELCLGAPITLTVGVVASADDADETPAGIVNLTSNDLDLGRRTVGIRFPAVAVPQDADILQASLELTVDELAAEPASVVIRGQATDEAAPFTTAPNDISARPTTAAAVSWDPIPAFNVVGETVRTPDLASVIEEIVHRPGWSSGNALALIAVGAGVREAVAFDGAADAAPRLSIEYCSLATPTPSASTILTSTGMATTPPTDTPTPSPSPSPSATATSTAMPTWTPTPTPGDLVLRFAVIGDYGNHSANAARVAALVNSWEPDFIITTGDNNYPDGEAATIDTNIGQFYSQYIGNYQGSYGSGSPTNRFWPSLGNHDWHTITCTGSTCTGAYFDYFTLPNNERYYDVDLGLVHLYALDSDRDEPDGRNSSSAQAQWLQARLAESTSCYDLVYFHHPPYSSGRHGSNSNLQWPFASWGAEAVFAGHDHLYERLEADGIPYFVNGAGGASLYTFDNLGNLPTGVTSVVRYNGDHGAMLVTATPTGITYEFYNADGVQIDVYTQAASCSATPTDRSLSVLQESVASQVYE
ncbi:metallophosphoesterase [Litorilinea aerophila]|nr:metallophosphoesterase [Litorilinea aerophila]MCC9078662.1 metallophosphoesterase [Litorilinea aerophila]